MKIDWSEVLRYDAGAAPSCLRRLHDAFSGPNHSKLQASAGDIVGWDTGEYIRVRMSGVEGYAHRIVWELHHGSIPKGKQIDHIDGNPRNNRLENLRVVSNAVNGRNKGTRRSNTSGVNGVSFASYVDRRSGKLYCYWRASWKEDGKVHHKNFSIAALGNKAALDAAMAFRCAVIVRLNEAGYGYTERHMKGNDE